MATFKCKRSGNFVSFKLKEDIEGMRKHEGYVEVIDVERPVDAPTTEDGQAMIAAILQKAEARKPGRPKKVV